MNLRKMLQRFLVPSVVVTGVYYLKYKCKVSPRAEVELSPHLTIGRNSEIGSFTKIKATEGLLDIGHDVSIANGCFISAETGGVTIGDFCMISPNVSIVGNGYKYDQLDVPICQQSKVSKGIKIGNNVWLGAGVVVLDGAEIGDGAIVSPNAVVSGRIPGNVIAQGDPAKVIFKRR